MPIFKSDTNLELARNVRMFLQVELRLTGLGTTLGKIGSRLRTIAPTKPSMEKVTVAGRRAGDPSPRLLSADVHNHVGNGGVRPEHLIWIFGAARTGSTWLLSMMKELEGHAGWNEPLVGLLFGNLYYVQAVRHVEKRGEDFILGQPYRESWLNSIRSFVLNEAAARHPGVTANGYLVIKEPNGSVGAPLLIEALPESRMILLIRDPRDMVASMLEAHTKDGWLYKWSDGAIRKQQPLLQKDPVTFARMQANNYLRNMENALQAYKSHAGPKVLVKYEDLRSDTLKTMEHIYSTLSITVDVSELARVVEKHSWENIPDEEKGTGKFNRKALPGAWREDLTTEQAEIVEKTAASIIEEFYPESPTVVEREPSAVRAEPVKPTPDEVREVISRVEHWYHRIEIAPGVVTPGVHDSQAALAAMEVPDRLDGKRLLDVGARDGFFSFVAEGRGADVLAIDAVAPEHLKGFSTAASLLGSSVEYRTMNVYNVRPGNVGTFDLIFFLGVLYHLRDPMLALDRLWAVSRPGATIWVESHVIDRGLVDLATGEYRGLASVAPALTDVPIAQFYPKDILAGNDTNWWGPNLAGLRAMVESAGFETLRSRLIGSRGLVVARKVEDDRTNFFREFDRKEMTGEEGMAWEHTSKAGRQAKARGQAGG